MRLQELNKVENGFNISKRKIIDKLKFISVFLKEFLQKAGLISEADRVARAKQIRPVL